MTAHTVIFIISILNTIFIFHFNFIILVNFLLFRQILFLPTISIFKLIHTLSSYTNWFNHFYVHSQKYFNCLYQNSMKNEKSQMADKSNCYFQTLNMSSIRHQCEMANRHSNCGIFLEKSKWMWTKNKNSLHSKQTNAQTLQL